MTTERRRIGVWARLTCGDGYCLYEVWTLAEALALARRMRESCRSLQPGPPLFPNSRVWIAPPPVIALKPANARYRKRYRENRG